MVENPKGPYQKHQNDGDEHDEEQMEDDEMEDGNDEEVFPESEEFEEIDSQLDMLNSVLDTMEHKNEVILAQLTSLLKENREIRMQLQQCPGLKPLEPFTPEKN